MDLFFWLQTYENFEGKINQKKREKNVEKNKSVVVTLWWVGAIEWEGKCIYHRVGLGAVEDGA